jgi:extradiol dioxygenase family protein
MSAPPFHLALPVHDLELTRGFYEGTLGCTVGRTSERWIDYDFFGHQLTTHRVSDLPARPERNTVDGDAVPARHFGVVLELPRWRELVARLREHAAPFLLDPRVRFEGQAGEQHTCFVLDPSGNALEFKAFASMDQLFARE